MPYRLLVAGALGAATLTLLSPDARAELVIKRPNDHPVYRAELEPHANFILYRYRDYGYGGRRYRPFGDAEFGGGFRASIELADPAFIPKINNTVAITFGLDFTNCYYCRRDFNIWSPVALQWNFFLTDRWSVFAEIGGILRTDGFFYDAWIDPAFWVGGRFHFNDKVSLTMRAGLPWVSVGVSFFVGD
jgi:hypothetical protein